jgi:hypothetical protein
MAKKKYLRIPVPITADTDYHPGPWQIEFMMRVNRIYRSVGVKGCTIDTVMGFQKYKTVWSPDGRPSAVYNSIKYKQSYYESIALLVKHGYVSPYPHCGHKGDKMGYIPADAPEATIYALKNGVPVLEHFYVASLLRSREIRNERRKELAKLKARGGSDEQPGGQADRGIREDTKNS